MQLKTKKIPVFTTEKEKTQRSLANQLAVAVAVLSSSAVEGESETKIQGDEWSFVGSILAYSEPDRVTAVEGILSAEKNFADTAKLTYKVVLDSLTGASANGAIPQSQVQTFTRPSGNGQYVIEPEETPLDDTFKDTRAQFNIAWSDAWREDSRYTLGANLSKEYDYLSISFNSEFAKDFDRKNTTLSIGGSIAFDHVEPEGGIPLGLSSMVIDLGQFANQEDYWNSFNATRSKTNDTLETTELLLGWTQTINRQMIVQFNYSYANVKGYLTDPFKIVSLINNSGVSQNYVYEKRPASRNQQTLFGLAKYHLTDSVLNFSYRYLLNDWEIASHTLDLKWHFFVDNNNYWEPHLRYYQQSAADFYTPYLISGQLLPEFVSADYRVGEMNTTTIGVKYGFTTQQGSRSEIRAEYYLQKPKNKFSGVPGVANSLEVNQEVDAFILQYTHFWK